MKHFSYMVVLAVALAVQPAYAREMSLAEWKSADSVAAWSELSDAEKEQSVKVMVNELFAIEAMLADETGASVLGPLAQTIGLGQELFPKNAGTKNMKNTDREDFLNAKIRPCLDKEANDPEYKGLPVSMYDRFTLCHVKYSIIFDAQKEKAK